MNEERAWRRLAHSTDYQQVKVNSPELYVSKNERRIGIVYGRVVNKLERVLFFLTAGRTPVDGDGDLK